MAVLLVGAIGACSAYEEPRPGSARGSSGAVAVEAPKPASGGSTAAVVQAGSTGSFVAPTLIPTSDAGPVSSPTAGKAGGASASCASVSAEAKARLLPSDIIWAIDTSGSMSASFPAIQKALVDFSAKVVAAGIDAHIVLLAGAGLCVPPPLGSGMCGVGSTSPIPIAPPGPPASAPDTKLPAFVHLNAIFGGNFGMGTILDNYSQYKEHLRPGAKTQLVMTEDGVPYVTAQAVRAHIEGKQSATTTPAWAPPLQPNQYVWNGVVCANGLGSGACAQAFGGAPTAMLELIKETGGILGDLAQAGTAGQDPFGPLLTELATAVIEGATLSCDYEIPPAPKGEAFDRDRVNVVYAPAQSTEKTYPRFNTLEQCADREGWAYDDFASPKRVLLCPRACESVQKEREGRMRVEFGCATVRGPD